MSFLEQKFIVQRLNNAGDSKIGALTFVLREEFQFC